MHHIGLSDPNQLYVLEKEVSNTFIRVPIRKVQFYSEALPQEDQHLLLGHTAIFCDQPQHLRDTILIKSIIFFPFNQFLENLKVWETNQCLEQKNKKLEFLDVLGLD